jgi:hypothetical protein
MMRSSLYVYRIHHDVLFSCFIDIFLKLPSSYFNGAHLIFPSSSDASDSALIFCTHDRVGLQNLNWLCLSGEMNSQSGVQEAPAVQEGSLLRRKQDERMVPRPRACVTAAAQYQSA